VRYPVFEGDARPGYLAGAYKMDLEVLGRVRRANRCGLDPGLGWGVGLSME
jgi:hypothetical protein